MTKLTLLFLFRLQNQLQLANLNSSNKDVRRHAFYTISGYIVAFLMFLGYVLFISIDLNIDNNIQAFFVLISSILFWAFGIWDILSGPDDLIKSKDRDFIFSLPLKTWQAKLLPLFSKYLIHIGLTFIVLMFGYLVTIAYIDHFFLAILFVLVLSLIIPLLSTNVTFLLAWVVRHVLSIIKWRNHVTESIITLGLFVAPLIYLIRSSASVDYKEWFIQASILRYPLNEINSFSFMQHIILLIGITAVTTSLVILLLTAFHHLVSSQNAVQSKKRRTNAIWHTHIPVTALLLKEFKLYFSSLTYVSNTILTPVAMIALNICILVGVIPNLHSFSYDVAGFTITAQHLFTFIMFTCVMLTTTTSCSLSFEGRRIWIMLTAPVSLIKIAASKMAVNILLFLPGIVLTAVVYAAIFQVRMLDLITIVALLFFSLLLISIVGFFINLHFPSYTWNNDMEVVKQSKATIITAIISMITIPAIIAVVYTGNLYLLLLIMGIEIAAIIVLLQKISCNNMMLN
ncbi:hypothetical protein [Gracilibacillus alcaliphilus]|uniref:hypothetical protein n=1 Tax=Gracilibacillus alcaliphilus TaxID=1401441 RepID=UPI00195E9F09|nr:hypothetical protein [Gracilibacillus alcaliphilus]MBM7677450.1 ABC-2 type transport system permease protein [Gracilibacillus alcaliphilus]